MSPDSVAQQLIGEDKRESFQTSITTHLQLYEKHLCQYSEISKMAGTSQVRFLGQKGRGVKVNEFHGQHLFDLRKYF